MLLNFMFCTENLQAQVQTECATPELTDMSKVMSTAKVNQIMANQNRAAVTYTVRVMFHLIRNTDGSDGPSDMEVLDQIPIMNANYAASDIDFELVGINYLDNDAWASTGDWLALTENTLAPAFATTCQLDIFVFPSGLGDIPGNSFNIPNHYLAMSQLRFGNTQNLSHEVGHCLGLLHTHQGINPCPAVSRENIARPPDANANCETTGDLCCDTAADPNLDFTGFDSGTCTYNNVLPDCTGASPYTPPFTNFMSYGWTCRTMFSACQIARMQAELSAGTVGPALIRNDGPSITCVPFNLILECGDPNNQDYIDVHLGLVSATTSGNVGHTISHFPKDFNLNTCGSATVVTFTATDNCGRTATCTTTIAIQDNTPPTFTAIPPNICDVIGCGADVDYWYNHWINYMKTGLAAEDACDSDVSISAIDIPVNTDCPDGTAETVVDFVATDNCGNSTIITGTFTIEATPSNLSLAGTITTEMSETVEKVSVTLAGNNNVIEMYETDSDGFYRFDDLTLNQNYSVTPFLNEGPLNGVSSFDLVLIAKHILQMEPLDSPYKMIAADINHSGKVTTADLVELRKVILHIDDNFQNNTSWRFVEAAFVFPQFNNPFATSFPEAMNINGLTPDEQHDFVGVKIGDVNGSAAPNGFKIADDRSFADDLVFSIADQQLKAGERYEVAFRADNFEAIHGYQFSLNFDQVSLKFEGIRTGELTNLNDSNFGLTLLEKGVITTSWSNQVAQSVAKNSEVFHVSFRAKADVKLSEVIRVSSQFTKAEAYNGNLELMDVQFRFEEGTKVLTNQFRLYQNTPNPFKQETLIGFELPEAASATLSIYDVSGRMLKQVQGNYAKGYNEVSLNKGDLPGTGVLYYQLVTADFEATKKMMVVE